MQRNTLIFNLGVFYTPKNIMGCDTVKNIEKDIKELIAKGFKEGKGENYKQGVMDCAELIVNALESKRAANK